MPKFCFHIGVTLRSYGNVEIEAESIEAALPLLTANYVGENISITETTTDSGQDLAVIDVSDADTGEELEEYDGLPLPSPHDPIDAAPLLAALKEIISAVHPNTGGTQGAIRACAVEAVAKAEGRADG